MTSRGEHVVVRRRLTIVTGPRDGDRGGAGDHREQLVDAGLRHDVALLARARPAWAPRNLRGRLLQPVAADVEAVLLARRPP